MGRSAKMTKRFSKADREARKINAQSGPSGTDNRSASPDTAAAPLSIPLFNTSVPGRIGKQTRQQANQQQLSGDMLDDDAAAQVAEPPVDVDDSEPAQKKKKGGLKDKVRAAKMAVQADEDRSNDKLSGAAKRKGKKPGVLGSVDYVKLHEARPGKKRFR